MILPTTMRLIDTPAAGAAEVMQLAQGSLPQPKAGEVLIRVIAAGVNRPDIAQRLGLYPPPADASPILGLEVAGEVVGGDQSIWRNGDRVCALANGGGYAEYCAVPAMQCLPWPRGYDALQAAALPENYFTVWANLFQIARLAAGDRVLVHGGSSGIGLTAIQLAAEFGASAFTTAGSQEKCAACLQAGAAVAINYRAQDFVEIVREYTQKRGVDIVLDMVAGDYTPRNLRCLAPDGRLVIIALQHGGVVEQLDLTRVMTQRLIITGSTMRPRSAAQKGEIAAQLRERVWPILEAGRCAPVIHQVFPLAEVAQAHRLMESSAHIGKIILQVA